MGVHQLLPWLVILMAAEAKSASGAAPNAVITGPKEAIAGDIVILDASQSSGIGYMWILTNSKKTFYSAEKGLRCLFSTREPGTYIFVLVVAGVTNNGGPDASMAEHRLELRDPVPAPPVVTIPDGAFGLTKLSYQEGAKVRVDDRPLLAKVADNFDAEAGAIAAGAREDVATTQDALKRANQGTVPDAKRQVFLPFFAKWQETVTAANEAGTIKTLEDYGKAYAATAAGLRLVK